jgi:sugar-specific transcriptional regulator TrmB
MEDEDDDDEGEMCDDCKNKFSEEINAVMRDLNRARREPRLYKDSEFLDKIGSRMVSMFNEARPELFLRKTFQPNSEQIRPESAETYYKIVTSMLEEARDDPEALHNPDFTNDLAKFINNMLLAYASPLRLSVPIAEFERLYE